MNDRQAKEQVTRGRVIRFFILGSCLGLAATSVRAWLPLPQSNVGMISIFALPLGMLFLGEFVANHLMPKIVKKARGMQFGGTYEAYAGGFLLGMLSAAWFYDWLGWPW